MSGPAHIELIGVDVAHEDDPHTVLVHDVNWRIAPGEWWVVCGGPGSGKSSLLSTAAGLSPAVDGSLRIFGQEVQSASEAEQVAWRRHIGFVFGDGGRLFGNLSVLENVLLPLQYHGDLEPADALRRAQELLALTELERYAHWPPSRLGSSLQQRVGLARALSVPIRVLFVDDPLSGLAPSAARWWLDFLDDLRERHAARSEPLALVAGAYDFGGWLDRADHFAVIEERGFHSLDGTEAAAAYREEAALAHQPGAAG
jgi:ABC-type transporter Mla maintaining outer membrane lipid asymmetry ATPase subunit MlaF